MKMIPLAVPNLSGREADYLQQCIESTFVSSVGQFVTRFEEDVARTVGAAAGIAMSSGTCALHLALREVGVSSGDLVILPSFTFIASANAVAHCGATPWLFDIDPKSWTIDVAQVRQTLDRDTEVRDGTRVHKASNRRVAALMPVFTIGNVPDMESLREVANDFGLPIVADAAAAIGAVPEKAALADTADLTCFSFNGNKTITAGGGGMVVGNDKAKLDHVRHVSATARVSADYEHDEVGFNYRMTNLQAAVGCAQLEQLENFIKRKREIRDFYEDFIATIDEIVPFVESPYGRNVAWFSGFVIREGVKLDASTICEKLKGEGVEARTFWKPVHLQVPFQGAPAETMKVTDSVWRRVVTLPVSTNIEDADLLKVRRAVLNAINVL